MTLQEKDLKVWRLIQAFYESNHDIVEFREKRDKRQAGKQQAPSAERGYEEVKGISAVYWRLLQSAQNANRKPYVIKLDHQDEKNRDSAHEWRKILFNFSPEKVYKEYIGQESKLRDAIQETFKFRGAQCGKGAKGRETIWESFTKSICDSAVFLHDFNFDFQTLKDYFEKTPENLRHIVPFVISTEIHGFGYALACDFLKECPGIDFDIAKPDVHLKEFCDKLDGAAYTPKETVRRVHQFAQNVAETDYDVDKAVWAICGAKHKEDFLEKVETLVRQS
jgi:hypothetical protein